MLKSFARVARVVFIINDLLLTQVLTRNRLMRNNSAVSALRGFTERDIAEIARQSQTPLQVFRHFPYRFILIGRGSL